VAPGRGQVVPDTDRSRDRVLVPIPIGAATEG
jgi:hypothetical protein